MSRGNRDRPDSAPASDPALRLSRVLMPVALMLTGAGWLYLIAAADLPPTAYGIIGAIVGLLFSARIEFTVSDPG